MQGGEFGFALLTLALSNKLFPAGFGQTILGTLLLSFAIGPILIIYNQKIANLLSFKKTPPVESDTEIVKKKFYWRAMLFYAATAELGKISPLFWSKKIFAIALHN